MEKLTHQSRDISIKYAKGDVDIYGYFLRIDCHRLDFVQIYRFLYIPFPTIHHQKHVIYT